MPREKKKCELCEAKASRKWWIKLNDPDNGKLIKKLHFCSDSCCWAFAIHYEKMIKEIMKQRKENGRGIKTNEQING